MEQIAFAKVHLNLLSSPLLLFLLSLVSFIIFKQISLSLKQKRLPPGPMPWPIVGNILHLGKKPHISMTHFAKQYGHLISLRLGTQLLVVGSSPVAATEILKNHDRLLSARYIPKAVPYTTPVLDRVSLVWTSECNDRWKFLRGLCRTELFSAKAIESQASLREKKVGEMVEFLGSKEEKVVNIGEAVFTTVFNMLANLVFSRNLISFGNDGSAAGLKSLVRRMMELVASPNVADFYPVLARLDPQGIKRKATECVNEMFGVWEVDIKERRARQAQDSSSKDFLDVFLANGFDDLQINWLSLELFSAGTDTTAATVEWAMAELLKNKQVMEKVQDELRREINKNPVKESHVCQLPYLNAIVKETLRLHPPAPLLVPHRAIETCEVMNYTIPKDTRVFVNVWAIGRDPSVWEDALSFKPERFLGGSNLDFKGRDFEFTPFGSGRRICPGLPMAAKLIPLILASLIHCFDWSLSNREDPSKLDMNEKFGITLQKEQPLLLVPKPRQLF